MDARLQRELQDLLNKIVPREPGPVTHDQLGALFAQEASLEWLKQLAEDSSNDTSGHESHLDDTSDRGSDADPGDPKATKKNTRVLGSGAKKTLEELVKSGTSPSDPVKYRWKKKQRVKDKTMSSYCSKLNVGFDLFFQRCPMKMKASRKLGEVTLKWEPTGKAASSSSEKAKPRRAREKPQKAAPSIAPYRDDPRFKLGGNTDEYYFISTASEALLPPTENVSQQKHLHDEGLTLAADWMQEFNEHPSRIIAERTLGFEGIYFSSGEDPTTALDRAIQRVQNFVRYVAMDPNCRSTSTLNVVLDSGMAKLRSVSTRTGKYFLNQPPCCENAATLLRNVKNTQLFGSVPTPEGPHVHLLLSRNVFRRVRHRYYCDAIDTSLEQQAYRITSAARPWCPLLTTSRAATRGKLESAFDFKIDFRAVGSLDADDETRACGIAHLAVRRLETLLPGNMVTRWQCHYSRRAELLYPVIEGLRDLLNLNHTSSGKAPWERIREWVEECCRSWRRTSRETCIEYLAALLLGGETDRPYDEIVDLLTRLLHEFATEKAKLVIIVENIHWADELTHQLVKRLADLAAPHNSNTTVTSDARARTTQDPPIRLICVQGKREGAPYPHPLDAFGSDSYLHELEDLSAPAIEYLAPYLQNPDTALLLHIAAWIGWDQPLSWLQYLWTQVASSQPDGNSDRPDGNSDRPDGNSDRPDGNSDSLDGAAPVGSFHDALEELIGAGILRSGGRLTPLIQDQHPDGIVFFTSIAMFDRARPETESELDTQFGQFFLQLIQEQLELAEQNVARLRRKVIIGDLLERIGRERWEKVLPLDQVARLWNLLARRAAAAGGIDEALRRSRNAMAIAFPQHPTDDRQVSAPLADSILTDHLTWMTEFHPDRKQLQPALRDAQSRFRNRIPGLDAPWEETHSWLRLGQALWQWLLRWEDLEQCRQVAEEMRKRVVRQQARSNGAPSVFWEVESLHLLAVTCLMQADLPDCLSAAATARTRCIQLKEFRSDPLLFAGKHDAAGCCKLLRAGVLQLTSSAEEKEAWLELNGFLKSKDEVSKLVTLFHVRLFDLLSGRSRDENRLFDDPPQSNSDNRKATKWYLFNKLVTASLRVMRIIEAEYANDMTAYERRQAMGGEPGKLLKGLADSQKFGSEFRPLWKAFEAFARFHSGSKAKPRDCLLRIEDAYQEAEERNEYLIQPEIAILAAILADRIGSKAQAHEWARLGCDRAEDLGITAYAPRFVELKARLSPQKPREED